LFLTNQHPVGTDMRGALDEQLRMLRLARDGGWDSVFTGHHYLTESSTQLQPVPFLARLAAESGHLQLGIGILLLTIAHPVALAEEIASLDVISGGRTILGVGLGYRAVEFDAFAVPKGSRVARFEANLDVVRRLWTGEPISVDLPWCHLDGARISVTPLQPDGPPVWIGATADTAVQRAARLADGWIVNPAAKAAVIDIQKDLYRAERTSAGREGLGTIAVFKEIYCAPTREEAVRIAAPLLERKYRSYASWGQADAHPRATTLELAFEQLRGQRFIVGTPEDCIRDLEWWRDVAGVEHFLLRSHWIGTPVEASLASMRLITNEVLPALRGG